MPNSPPCIRRAQPPDLAHKAKGGFLSSRLVGGEVDGVDHLGSSLNEVALGRIELDSRQKPVPTFCRML